MIPSTNRLHMKEAATITQPHPPSGGTTISTSMFCQTVKFKHFRIKVYILWTQKKNLMQKLPRNSLLTMEITEIQNIFGSHEAVIT